MAGGASVLGAFLLFALMESAVFGGVDSMLELVQPVGVLVLGAYVAGALLVIGALYDRLDVAAQVLIELPMRLIRQFLVGMVGVVAVAVVIGLLVMAALLYFGVL